METEINWNATKEDCELIKKIAKRAVELWPEADALNVVMNITATHLNGCPLDLPELLHADEVIFQHDIAGIAHFLDREDGRLVGFVPRCAKRQILVFGSVRACAEPPVPIDPFMEMIGEIEDGLQPQIHRKPSNVRQLRPKGAGKKHRLRKIKKASRRRNRS